MRSLSQRTLKRVNRWRLAAVVGLLLSIIVIVLSVDNLLLSTLIAFVVSYTLGPMVSHIERLGLSRALATVLVFAIVGLLIAGLGFLIAPYLGQTTYRLKEDTPRIIEGVGRFISDAETKIQSFSGPLATFDFTARAENYLTAWTSHFFETIPSFLRMFLTVMLLGPFLAFFMVKDGRLIMRGILGLVPNHLFEPALSLLHQINMQIGQFVRARLLESFVVGLVTTAGLLIINFPYAALLGIFAGVTNLVPYLGPLLGAVPAFIIASVNGYTALNLAAVATVYMIAQLIDAGFLIPLMVAKIVDLHPVTVIVVMILGAQVLGILGMIISIPVATTIKVTVSTIYRHLIDTRT